MSKITLKKLNDSYEAIYETAFSIGKINKKSKDKMVIHTGANVKTMQQVYKERLQEMADLMEFSKSEERKDFDEALEQYARYKILEALSIEETPLRAITDDEENVVEIEGFKEGLELEIEEKSWSE